MDKRPALGKGLSALIPDLPPAAASGPLEVDIDRLSPNELQPRMQFDDAKLEELTRSIKDKGIIQPILVRPLAGGGGAPRSGLGCSRSPWWSERWPTAPIKSCSSSR